MAQPTTDDRERLIQFLGETLELLRGLIGEGVDPKGRPLIDRELLPLLRRAWEEFNEQFSFGEAAEKIRNVASERLVWAGLYGAQLTAKLASIARFRGRYLSIGGGKWAKKLLDAIDRLLDSLVAATGVDEALKELKELLSDNIEVEDKP